MEHQKDLGRTGVYLQRQDPSFALPLHIVYTFRIALLPCSCLRTYHDLPSAPFVPEGFALSRKRRETGEKPIWYSPVI